MVLWPFPVVFPKMWHFKLIRVALKQIYTCEHMNTWWRHRPEKNKKKKEKTARKCELCKQVRSCSSEHMKGMSATRWSERRRWQKVGNRELEERSRGEQLPCGPHYFPAVNFTCIFSPLCCRLEGRMFSPSETKKRTCFLSSFDTVKA